MATALVATGSPATAAPPIGLGVATSFGVLAGSTVTNSGPTVVTGDLGVSPGNAIVGFDQPGGPGSVIDGSIHAADSLAGQAQAAVTTAYIQAANSPTSETVTNTNLGNRTLQPGVYTDTSDMELTGTVTLDGGGDPAAVFIFQAGRASPSPAAAPSPSSAQPSRATSSGRSPARRPSAPTPTSPARSWP